MPSFSSILHVSVCLLFTKYSKYSSQKHYQCQRKSIETLPTPPSFSEQISKNFNVNKCPCEMSEVNCRLYLFLHTRGKKRSLLQAIWSFFKPFLRVQLARLYRTWFKTKKFFSCKKKKMLVEIQLTIYSKVIS